ncbi:MAG: hypothetical protein GW939_03700 [Candidatus Magasanikbacteria bacterium]|uniref:Uncharacterized protein n=1 Tax=Candidatus Magasanikbacteria bacterium CG10_big_fil_rev_8_21_14_0_10_38_6 TaxID=1974647 RepID=A0A2M6P0U5_9BACT|nr:hypothetical protein [Candidatus Magasanikbacteria bacterium]NCS71812.1 hypothetical protein [Candidatus Magasanikbacteria bacterium]PIR77020.1 MAG: hypothetical protein COU30_04735 [Candidatus Magasanikbacteria bacterium CG10_big_fil_rev_8_21_14_0_10_38_6]
MNLYEYEGKKLFEKSGIAIPKGVVISRNQDAKKAYNDLGITDVVVKAQVLSGKRGKNNGIQFCSNEQEVEDACQKIFSMDIRGQYVAAIRIEEKLSIAEEHYLSITYDTNAKQPILVYSAEGGVDIEDVPHEQIIITYLDIRNSNIKQETPYSDMAQKLWKCFLNNDCRLVEINPLVKTTEGEWIAADAKVAIDDDAFYRHEEWQTFEPRTMLGRPATEREIVVQEIDKGEKYYQGTAGKYIEMDGNIAILFSGGGASIANMDALANVGLSAANYTEYSGNPPREKVYALTKIVLSKPEVKGLWIAGGVANFTNIKETFQGIIDALDEVKPTYPIVVRRAGPYEQEGMDIMKDCAQRNNLNIKLFGKESSMSETAQVLADMINS